MPESDLPHTPNEAVNPKSETSDLPPKKSKKKYLWILLLLVLMVGGWYGYKIVNPDISGPRINPLNLIPGDALYILETDKPYKLWYELTDTEIWTLLEQDREWKEYGTMLAEIEDDLSGFHKALDILANRKVFISGHSYRREKTDHLFIVDFEGLGVVSAWMTSLDNVTKRNYQGSTIYEKLDLSSKETFYFALEDNFLVGSFTHSIIEQAIDEKQKATLPRSFEFLDVHKKVIGDGLVRLYVNYASIFSYLEQLGIEDLASISERMPLLFSGLYFDIQENSLLLKGYSNYNDSLSSYLKLFRTTGSGPMDISTVAPASTSMYMSIGFDSFDEFYTELADQLLTDEVAKEDFDLYTSRTEKFLNISLKEDVAAWIDDELALIQFENEGTSETAFILKGKNADLTREKMTFLSRQIKRKTPVRFKEVEYQGYKINYMAVKGLFSLVFGKLFEKFDRPYYTIIDEYVVFASSPKSLRTIIDAQISKQTLDHEDSYQQFVDEIGQNHSLALYLQMELLGKSKGGLIDDETIEYLSTKSKFFSHFPQMGFKFSPSGDLIETHMVISVNNLELFEAYDFDALLDSLNFDSLLVVDPGEQIVIGEIEIEDLGAKSQTEQDSAGNTKYEMEIKDGLRHGNFFEYHPSGELKSKGKYKNDLKDGTWKYYDSLGRLTKKEKYRNGELIDG